MAAKLILIALSLTSVWIGHSAWAYASSAAVRGGRGGVPAGGDGIEIPARLGGVASRTTANVRMPRRPKRLVPTRIILALTSRPVFGRPSTLPRDKSGDAGFLRPTDAPLSSEQDGPLLSPSAAIEPHRTGPPARRGSKLPT